MKFWNPQRIRRRKERQARREERAYQEYLQRVVRERRYSSGDPRKNARLMMDALSLPIHRRILSYLRKGGAMSVSNIAEHFDIMLQEALRHVQLLERSGLIVTKKNGRIRFCIYNPEAPKELSQWFSSQNPFDLE